MERILIELPAEVVDAARLPVGELERELYKELALALYRRGVLPFGKARLLANLTHWEFEELLGKSQVPRHYSAADLEEDIAYGLGR